MTHEFTYWREIPGRGWGSGIVTNGLPMRPFLPEFESHPGAMAIAEIDVGGGKNITAISVCGLLEFATIAGKSTGGYSTTTMQRMLSDLTFLLDGYYGKRSIVMGGDTNISTQLKPPWTAHHQAVLDRIKAFGLVDCLGKFHEGYVQTQRHPHSSVAWQNDYIYADERLADHVVSCDPIYDERVWALSQHCPVLLELEF